MEKLVTSLRNLAEALQEAVATEGHDVELESHEDFALHFQDLLLGERVV